MSRRTGILKGTALGGGLLNNGQEYNWVAEVEELDRIQNLSKLEYKSVSGADKGMLLEILPEWIESKEVIWRDNEE